MKTKLLSTVAAGMLLAMAGVASAAEPVQLSAAQMDAVTAGGIAKALALADAFGKLSAATATAVESSVVVVKIKPTQGGQITWDVTTALAKSSSSAL